MLFFRFCLADTAITSVFVTVCGNGTKETGEQCDGADLNGQSCVSLNYSTGNLTCTADCAFNTFDCVSAGGGGTMPPEWHNPPGKPPGAPPDESGYRVIINDDVKYTNTSTVVLTLLSGQYTYKMAISNDQKFTAKSSTDQIPFQSSYLWDLCRGQTKCHDGEYKVYAKFYSSWGKSSPVVSDSIIYRQEAAPLKPSGKLPAEECAAVCKKITYDLYIVNPDKGERHMTDKKFVRTTNLGGGKTRLRFEDSGTDFDYNDLVLQVDKSDCKKVKVSWISSDALWHHQVRIKISYDNGEVDDLLLWPDSHIAQTAPKVFDALPFLDCEELAAPAEKVSFLEKLPEILKPLMPEFLKPAKPAPSEIKPSEVKPPEAIAPRVQPEVKPSTVPAEVKPTEKVPSKVKPSEVPLTEAEPSKPPTEKPAPEELGLLRKLLLEILKIWLFLKNLIIG